MEKTTTPPADYIESLPEDTRADVERLDAVIGGIMSHHPKTMWEGKLWGGSDQKIIGYGDYAYRKSNRDVVEWFIVGLAVQKKYLSIYVNATDDSGYLAERYADRLGKVKVGKSSVSFDSVADIDLEVLAELVGEARRLMS